MKICPTCNARVFEDMDICYGCMHHFTEAAGLTNGSGLASVGERETSYKSGDAIEMGSAGFEVFGASFDPEPAVSHAGIRDKRAEQPSTALPLSIALSPVVPAESDAAEKKNPSEIFHRSGYVVIPMLTSEKLDSGKEAIQFELSVSVELGQPTLARIDW